MYSAIILPGQCCNISLPFYGKSYDAKLTKDVAQTQLVYISPDNFIVARNNKNRDSTTNFNNVYQFEKHDFCMLLLYILILMTEHKLASFRLCLIDSID